MKSSGTRSWKRSLIEFTKITLGVFHDFGAAIRSWCSVTEKPFAYLAGAGAGQRAALDKLRKTIRAVAPEAEECINYGLAAFRLNGRPLVAFGAWANHCAFYPMSSATVKAFQDQLKSFETSKGTIRFTADKPLPTALVKKMVKARIAENGF